MKASKIVLCITILINQTSAFVTRLTLSPPLASLYAKGKQKGTQSSPAASGFGGGKQKVAETTTEDVVAFPALEPHIAETLLKFDGDNSKAEDLTPEVYGRIAAIYGFRSFNYLMEEAPTASLESLLSAPIPEEKSSERNDLLTPPAVGNLADLLSSATGGRIESAYKEERQQIEPLPLTNLPAFDKFRVLHVDPLVLSIDDFFSPEECNDYVHKSTATTSSFPPMESRSKTVGKDAMSEAQRTSTTWFHHYRTVPELMAKASRLMGLDDITRWEEPQTVRYRRKEKFTWHLDALAPSDELEKRGGQRVATLLVYLTDLAGDEGGATMFRDLGGSDGPLRVYVNDLTCLLSFVFMKVLSSA